MAQCSLYLAADVSPFLSKQGFCLTYSSSRLHSADRRPFILCLLLTGRLPGSDASYFTWWRLINGLYSHMLSNKYSDYRHIRWRKLILFLTSFSVKCLTQLKQIVYLWCLSFTSTSFSQKLLWLNFLLKSQRFHKTQEINCLTFTERYVKHFTEQSHHRRLFLFSSFFFLFTVLAPLVFPSSETASCCMGFIGSSNPYW